MIVSEQQAKEWLENMDKWEPMVQANYRELGEPYGDMAKAEDSRDRKLLNTIIALYSELRKKEQLIYNLVQTLDGK